MSSAEMFMASDGHIELPTKPGLGFDLIESEVEKTVEYTEELGGATTKTTALSRIGSVAMRGRVFEKLVEKILQHLPEEFR